MAEMVAIRSLGTAGKGAGVSLDSNSCNATSTGGSFIILDAEGRGGNGGYTDTGFGGDGGAAAVSISKSVVALSLTIQTTAYGGDGGSITFGGTLGFSGSGNGGAANATTNAVDESGPVVAAASAIAGAGGGSVEGGEGGSGGIAVSDAQGTTVGDFLVEVSSTARGGDAGTGTPQHNLRSFDGGDGGDAFATASGSNNGISAVSVSSSATAGAGAHSFGEDFQDRINGISGDATAISSASGLGAVTSTATAISNFITPGSSPIFSVINPVFGGDALAHATATGQSGTATATAQTGGGAFSNVSASATAPVGGSADVKSQALMNGATPTLAMADGLQSAAFVTARPSDASPVVASIVQGAFYPGIGSGLPETFNSEVDFSIDLDRLGVVNNLQIHFLSAASTGAGFDMLTFQIYDEDLVVENDVFTDLASATAFFTNHTLDLGAAQEGSTGTLDLRFVFSLTGSQLGDGFSVAYTADVRDGDGLGVGRTADVPSRLPSDSCSADSWSLSSYARESALRKGCAMEV